MNTADAGAGAADYALRLREQAICERIDASITADEKNANEVAVSNRSGPLMETLGGFAIAGGLMYGGYSVVAMGAQPASSSRS